MKERWTARVTRESNALDLEKDVFKLSNPKQIAASLKHSAEISQRRKTTPFQSAMSMLNFYINRAGKNLSEDKRQVLEKSKDELRSLYGRKRLSTKLSRRPKK